MERYLSSRQHKVRKTGTKEGIDLDSQIKKQWKGIFNQQCVVMASECHLCGKPRCIFTLAKGKDGKEKGNATRKYLQNTIPLQCGTPLFAVDPDMFPLANDIYVQHSLTCTMEVTMHCYSADCSLILSSVCIYCGTKKELVTANARDSKGRTVRPYCTSCVNAGLEHVSYGKQQIAQLSGNKQNRACSLRLKMTCLCCVYKKYMLEEYTV
jgi:hypothetical protein